MIHCGGAVVKVLARRDYVYTPEIPHCSDCSDGTTIEMIRCGNAIEKQSCVLIICISE